MGPLVILAVIIVIVIIIVSIIVAVLFLTGANSNNANGGNNAGNNANGGNNAGNNAGNNGSNNGSNNSNGGNSVVVPNLPVLYRFTGTAVAADAVKTWAPGQSNLRFDYTSTPQMVNNVDNVRLPVSDKYAGSALQGSNLVVVVNKSYTLKATRLMYQTVGNQNFHGVLFFTETPEAALHHHGALANTLENKPLEVVVYQG